MLAYVAAVLLAATAAAIPNAAVMPRHVLNDTPANQVCDPTQHLVCCDETRKCTEIVIDDHNKHNELSAYTHCTAVVACCTFQIAESGNKNWGDIINENVCIYKGNLLGSGA